MKKASQMLTINSLRSNVAYLSPPPPLPKKKERKEKTFGFLMFSGASDKQHWTAMRCSYILSY